MTHPAPMDRLVKSLFRAFPDLLFRILQVPVEPDAVRAGDVNVNLPEFRADQVLFVGADADPARWALHVEFQIQPDTRVMRGWFLKNAALNAQLRIPVVLLVVYLERGDRAQFPDRYELEAGGLRTEFRFETVRLWEHADRARTGDLAALAPLLVTWENEPALETVREELRLIEAATPDEEKRSELLALAYTAARRFFTVEVLMRIFDDEELQPALDEILEFPSVRRRIEQSCEQASARSREEGREEGVRDLLLSVLTERFGVLPAHVSAWVSTASEAQCRSLLSAALRAGSLDELKFPEA
jgi:predicted transposase YdaD